MSSTTPSALVDPDLPTPVSPLRLRGTTGLWLKDDGLSAQPYGGNKVRKLAHVLPDVLRRGARRIVTVGAAGSHHALATAIYGRRAGLNVCALMTGQAYSEHAERTFRAALGAGLEVLPLQSVASLGVVLRGAAKGGDYWIGPGAMGGLGGLGYAAAALELWQQVRSGEIPAPARIVVAVGSGSTAAGLLVGLAETPLPSRLVGVLVAKNPVARSIILGQATLVARKMGSPLRLRAWSQRLELRSDAVGPGYGIPSAAAERATKIAADVGLKLDPTYTSKACAVACDLALNDTEPTLYWHTLSSAPLEPLLASAPTFDQLPARLRELLRPNTLGDHPKPAGSE